MNHLHPFRPRTLLFTLLVQGCAVGLADPARDGVEDVSDPAVQDDETFGPIEDDRPAPRSNRPDVPFEASLTADAGGRDPLPSPVDAGMVRPDVAPAADVALVSPPDVGWADAASIADNRRTDVPGPTAMDAGPPTRWLSVTLDPLAQRECPGQWALVLWGPDGEEVPMLRKRCTRPRSSAVRSPDARLAAWRLSLHGRPRVPLPRPCSGGVSGLAHGGRAA